MCLPHSKQSSFYTLKKIFFFLLIFFCIPCFADNQNLDQQFKSWNDLNVFGSMPNCLKCKYLFGSFTRFAAEPGTFEEELLQGGLGYQFFPALSLWAGYQWVSPNTAFHHSQQNRIWQQGLWQIVNTDHQDFSLRNRLEERQRGGQPQWSTRLRERITLRFLREIDGKYSPVIYDEIFFNLNKPSWIRTNTFDQNRLFIGIDIPTFKKCFIETGYINQYINSFTRPVMGHILYFSLNVII